MRAHDGSADDVFAAAAAKLSNCPSGATGGALGWLGAEDCASEPVREAYPLGGWCRVPVLLG